MNNANYAYSLEKNNDMYLIPIGKVIQVDGQLENLIVRNEVNGCPLKSGHCAFAVKKQKLSNAISNNFVTFIMLNIYCSILCFYEIRFFNHKTNPGSGLVVWSYQIV